MLTMSVFYYLGGTNSFQLSLRSTYIFLPLAIRQTHGVRATMVTTLVLEVHKILTEIQILVRQNEILIHMLMR
jgi:hypothetical protein